MFVKINLDKSRVNWKGIGRYCGMLFLLWRLELKKLARSRDAASNGNWNAVYRAYCSLHLDFPMIPKVSFKTAVDRLGDFLHHLSRHKVSNLSFCSPSLPPHLLLCFPFIIASFSSELFWRSDEKFTRLYTLILPELRLVPTAMEEWKDGFVWFFSSIALSSLLSSIIFSLNYHLYYSMSFCSSSISLRNSVHSFIGRRVLVFSR